MFTFSWKIENFSMCVENTDEYIASPSFMVDSIHKSSWVLMLYPRGKKGGGCFACNLFRYKPFDKGPDNIEVGFSITLVAADVSSNITAEVVNHTFSQKKASYCLDMANRAEIFLHRNVFLPKDVLTIQCSMWSTGSESKTIPGRSATLQTIVSHQYPGQLELATPDVLEELYTSVVEEQSTTGIKKAFSPTLCSALTTIEVEKSSIVWSLHGLDELVNQKKSIPVVSAFPQVPSLILTFCFMEDIQFYIRGLSSDSGVFFCNCKVQVLDVSCRFETIGEDSKLFSSKETTWILPMLINNSVALERMYIRDGTMVVRFELAISFGEKWSRVEATQRDFPEFRHPHVRISDLRNLRKELQRKFCNLILANRNQVLTSSQALVSFQQSVTGVRTHGDGVDFSDLDPHTLNALLLFMYSETLEDLSWEGAIKLYEAGDRYDIDALKKEMTYFLLSRLSLENVCNGLEIADAYSDNSFRSSIQEYVSSNALRIFQSNKWKRFLQLKPVMAAEVMHAVCMAKLDA